MSTFGIKLANLVTEQDRKASGKRNYNRYALGIMLNAANECVAEIEAGSSPEDSFSDHFTPTRENHAIAKALGLRLDVQRGQWVKI